MRRLIGQDSNCSKESENIGATFAGGEGIPVPGADAINGTATMNSRGASDGAESGADSQWIRHPFTPFSHLMFRS